MRASLRAPSVSVVMPTYNSARFVREAVESVRQQTIDSWELLLVDDASTDATPSILCALEESDTRIKVTRCSVNAGPATARNLAIAKAKGRYIAFLDSDDLWRHDKLEKQLNLFQRTRAPLVYSAYEKVNEEGERRGRVVQVPGSVTYDEMLSATIIATCTAVYDTARVGKVLMPEIRKRQDFALWLKILRQSAPAQGLAEPLAYLRKRPGSVSSNKLSALSYTWQVYRDLERLSLARTLVCFTKYTVRAAAKARI
jgi:teichuronic acid biosynthesis glycosyltransferase TuaG